MFDRVVASSLLSHVLHPDRIITEIRRVTRPGGRVVISVCHEDQIERGLRWARALGLQRRMLGDVEAPGPARIYSVEYHLHRFSPQRLIDVIGGALRIVSMTRVPFIFPVHWVAACERVD
jgi:ubiquinone/menaquinone biosynthesis C-methylase UbiE